MTPFPSRHHRTLPARHLALAAVALIAVVVPSIAFIGALVTTDRYIVREGQEVTEDQYVTAMNVTVDGVVDADLTVFSGSVTIRGRVNGTLTLISAGTLTIEEGGAVEGSVNGAAIAVSVDGTVGGDVFVTAGSIVIEDTGVVGRDAMGFGGTFRIDGNVERDVRGRSYRVTVDGGVGGDVDIASQSFSIGPTAEIDGDVLYRSSSDASISPDAVVVGTVTRLPTQSNFVYGLILSLANVVGFLGFFVAGLLALWLLRGTGSRAVGSMLTKPVQSLLVGIVTVIGVPLMVIAFAVTLVGIPLSIALVAIGIVGFIIGAVPAVTALGNLILVRRGGLFGAFVVGAVVWRIGIWIIPFVGGYLFLLGLVWGTGAWVLGVIASRRAEPIAPQLLPATIIAAADAPQDWEPPLAPGRRPEPEAMEQAAAEPIADDDLQSADGLSHDAVEPDDGVAESVDGSATSPAVPQDPDAAIVFEPQGAREEPGVDSQDDAEAASYHDRFEELRDELRTSGTVAPPSDANAADDDVDREQGRDDRGQDEEGRDPDDWGLPSS